MTIPRSLVPCCLALVLASGSGCRSEKNSKKPDHSAQPVEVVRVGHIFLDIQPAVEALAAAYEDVCRQRGENVRILQQAVPQRMYASWFMTQLVSEDPAELLALNVGSNTERLARHFESLSTILAQPNPYNAGTELEGIPWRETFPDGLPTSYNPTLLDYYSIPMTNTTTRLVVNFALYREIVGDRPLPDTYEAFMTLCREAHAFAARTKREISPIASSSYHAPVLLRLITRTQTQRLAEVLNVTHTLRFTDAEQRVAYLNGNYTLHSPPIHDLVAMTGDLAGHMTPGFYQLTRDNALLGFVQGRALMLVSFSNEAKTVRDLVSFPTQAFRVPAPDPGTPRFGVHARGRMEDRSYTSNFGLALTRNGRNQARALDFLKFAGSQRGNQIFCDHAWWIPSVAHVRPQPDVAAYLPDTNGGYQLGFDLSSHDITRMGECDRVVMNHLHLLANPRAGPERFVQQVEGAYAAAVRRDADKEARETWETVRRSDGMIALLDRLAASEVGDADTHAAKRDRLWEASLEQEATARLLQKSLTR